MTGTPSTNIALGSQRCYGSYNLQKTMTTQTTKRNRTTEKPRPSTARFDAEECRLILRAFREARDSGSSLRYERFESLNKIESKLLRRIRSAEKDSQEKAFPVNLQDESGSTEIGGNLSEGSGGGDLGETSRPSGSEDPDLSVRSSSAA